MITAIRNKFPDLEQLAKVYSVIVAMIYPWSMLRFFWRLSSWLYFSTLTDIAFVFNYMVVVNLLESLFVLIWPVLMSLFLPAKWFYKDFVSKGSIMVLLGLGYFMYFADHLNSQAPFPLDLVYIAPFVGILILILVFLLGSIRVVNDLVSEVTNRLIIFLYISIPVSILSVLIVLARNIF